MKQERNNMRELECNRCGKVKPLTAFTKQTKLVGGTDRGYQQPCRLCVKEKKQGESKEGMYDPNGAAAKYYILGITNLAKN